MMSVNWVVNLLQNFIHRYLQSAFRKTGIYPFNRNAISTETVSPAEVFNQNQIQQTSTNLDQNVDDQIQETVTGSQIIMLFHRVRFCQTNLMN